MKLQVICITAGLLCASHTNALSIEKTREAYTQGGDGRLTTEVYLAGMAQGFMWANAELDSRETPRIFCPPPKLPLSGSTVYQLSINYVDENKGWLDEELPMGFATLQALLEAFPCDQ